MPLKLNSASGSITISAQDGTGNADITLPRSGIGSVSTLSDLGITATSAELNTLDGYTGALADLNRLDVTTEGTVEASKVVTADASGNVNFGSGNILVDTNTFKIDSTNNRVGIGTASPSTRLDVSQQGQSNTAVFTNTNASWANDVGFKYEPSGTPVSDFAISNRSNGSVWLGSGYGPIHFQLDENEANSRSTKVTIQSNGDVDINNELKAGSYNETYAAVTSNTNAAYIDCHAGNAFSHTLTENTTFTFVNPPASGTSFSFSLEIIQDASASGYTVTWNSVIWPSATAPTLTATASAKDVFIFQTTDGGVTWYGFTAGQALA